MAGLKTDVGEVSLIQCFNFDFLIKHGHSIEVFGLNFFHLQAHKVHPEWIQRSLAPPRSNQATM